MLRILTFVFTLFMGPILLAQTGCPGCTVDLPADLAVDTIYLSMAPDGTAGQVYSENLSFRLPKTTTPVNALDPETPAGLDINQITILGVGSVPPGLNWQASQLTYVVEDETDGCVRLCGTPLFPGYYEMEVFIEAEIFIFSQTTSVTIPIVIHPSESQTDGFTIVNSSGCGEVTASFINNIPSNGQDGFSYLWFFDNGNSTVAETPQPQTYTEPGTYTVDYEAIIDTVGFILTEVSVDASPCTDIFGGSPDMKFVVFDPSGEHVYTAPIVGNTDAPVSWDVNILLEEGNYELHVVDDDGGLDGADDLCGIINFGQELGGTLSSGDLTVTLNIIHPVDTVRFSEDITVFDIPETPILLSPPNTPYCLGDLEHLSVLNFMNDLTVTWSQDSVVLFDENMSTIEITENGFYEVVYTSEDGCSSETASYDMVFSELPAEFELMQEGNLLSVVDETVLPGTFEFSWYFEGQVIPDATDLLLCTDADGIYSLLVTDTSTGCSLQVDIGGTYTAGVFCSTPANEIRENALNIYPNPTNGQVFITGTESDISGMEVRLFSVLGQQLGHWITDATQSIDLSHLPSDTYVILFFQDGQLVKQERLVKI